MSIPKQARGYEGALTLVHETAPGETGTTPKGYVIPVINESLSGQEERASQQLLRKKFAPARPSRGARTVDGDVQMAFDVFFLGQILRAMMGAPATTPVSALEVPAGSMQDKGAGRVGIPFPAHGLSRGAEVSVVGFDAIDGVHTLFKGTSADEIQVVAPYATESLDGSERIHRGRRQLLDAGEVVNVGGKAAFPLAGHGYQVGEHVAVSGCAEAAYNATHMVRPGSTADLILTDADYAAETLVGDEVVAHAMYRHVYTLPAVQPTVCLEREVGAGARPFTQHFGCKVGGLTFDTMATELKVAAQVMGMFRQDSAASIVAAQDLTSYPDLFMRGYGSSLRINGEFAAWVTGVDMNLSRNLEGHMTFGDDGERGIITEGMTNVQASVRALFVNDELLELARAGVRLDVDLTWIVGGNELILNLPECEFGDANTPLSGPEGQVITLDLHHFQEFSSEPVTATLINSIASYGG